MDTVVSNPMVAMGQHDQQILHPFFRQDFKNGPMLESTSSSAPANAATTHALCPNPPAADSSISHATGRNVSKPPNEPSAIDTRKSAPPCPEEEPNADRRKRRKIEKRRTTGNEAPLKASLSQWIGKDSEPSSDLNRSPFDAEPSCATPLPSAASSNKPPTQTSIPEPQQTAAAYSDAVDGAGKRRKILKLNLNGRLLSSPPRSPPNTAAPKRKTDKRGKSRKNESKLLIIKYRLGGDRDIAKLIDEILNGKKRLGVSAQRANPPLQHANQPPKPTHPFFMKRASQKLLSEAANGNGKPPLKDKLFPDAGQRVMVNSKPPTRTSEKPLSTFGRHKKFSELVDPLWPPRDLVHIGSDYPYAKAADLRLLRNDRKKAKTPAISVGDAENVLLNGTLLVRENGDPLSRNPSSRVALRQPLRHVASGRALQIAVDNQMSWSLSNLSSNMNNGVIARLRSQLLSSFSAFDRGRYESQLWTHKYAPKSADDVLQPGREAQVLRDWLKHLKVTSVDTGKAPTDNSTSKLKRDKKRKKRRKPADSLGGFIVSSEEENSEMDNMSGSDDELAGDVTVSAQRTVIRSGDLVASSQGKSGISNAIVLSGPTGCGKTASVYAVAKELEFEVFEINPGGRRSARDMLERVGDMTRNHLVHLLNEPDDSSIPPDSKQNKLMNFLKGQSSKNATAAPEPPESSLKQDHETKRAREQKQSLILLEEADILFEEDKQFWTGVLTLIGQSKRPIVITCNDERLIPLQDLSLHAILRYHQPPRELALDYLLLVAANEGHLLKRDAVGTLYNGCDTDIRRSLMELSFWCQMGVGSEKSGLDWILPQWPPGSNVDQDGNQVRVLSLSTYESYMGWFNRDCLFSDCALEQTNEALGNTFENWGLGIQDLEDVSGPSKAELLSFEEFQARSKLEQLDTISMEADYLDMRSALDILCSGCAKDTLKDVVDPTAPPPPEAHRSNYVEAYPLLHADLRPEYSSLSEPISVTFGALLSTVFHPIDKDIESTTATRIFNSWAKSSARGRISPQTKAGFQKVFEPIMRANYSFPQPTGRIAPSFENGLAPITEDIAPYIRGIMVFDGRLKIYRDNLYAAWSHEHGHGEKRARTTRASRAALEGSDKAFTRRERWFPDDTNYYLVQNTGMPEWQTCLFHLGHFQVPPVEASSGNQHEDHSSEL